MREGIGGASALSRCQTEIVSCLKLCDRNGAFGLTDGLASIWIRCRILAPGGTRCPFRLSLLRRLTGFFPGSAHRRWLCLPPGGILRARSIMDIASASGPNGTPTLQVLHDSSGAETDQSAFGRNHQKAAVPFTTSKQTLLFHSRNKRCLATLMSAEAHPPYAGAHGWELSNGQTR